MYLDSRSNVTVGVGLMLRNSAAASALPFVDSAGNPSSVAGIAIDFDRVAAMTPNMRPRYYLAPTSPHLTQTEIDARLTAFLQGVEAALRAGIPGYDALPDPAKMALLDMGYNLGTTKLLTTYPHLLAAIAAGDWTGAAAQSARGGIGATRNAWTKNEFLAAADPAGPAT
jgi:GH24 family phage-related lysozyme (muramidase)